MTSRNKRQQRVASPTAKDIERAERLREVMKNLSEGNRLFPVIVEGKRDAAALKELGLTGEVITFNRGQSVYDFCNSITARHFRVILLTDWDKRGNELMRKLGDGLHGHWEELSDYRRLLKIMCQKHCKDVEGIPSLLRRLEGIEGFSGQKRRGHSSTVS